MKSCDQQHTLQKRATTKLCRHKQKKIYQNFDLLPAANFHFQKGAVPCCNTAEPIGSYKTRECCPPCILSKYQSPLLVITTVPSCQTVLGSVVQKAGEVCTCPRVPLKILGDKQTAHSADNLRKESSVARGSAEH